MSLRSAVRGVAEKLLVQLPRRTSSGDRLILSYHNVVPSSWSPRGDKSLHLPLNKFEEQLRIIRNEAELVPLMELLTIDAPNDRRVAITFDDAYASALELGLGACCASGIACTVFVAPSLLDTVPPWDLLAERGEWGEAARERFLWQGRGRSNTDLATPVGRVVDPAIRIGSAENLLGAVNASGSLVSLGNHSMTHANLGALSAPEVEQELADAEKWLRVHAPAARIPVVAYPYGIAPREAANADRDAEYGLLVSGGWIRANGPGQVDRWRIPRWNVPAGISANGFNIRLRGRML